MKGCFSRSPATALLAAQAARSAYFKANKWNPCSDNKRPPPPQITYLLAGPCNPLIDGGIPAHYHRSVVWCGRQNCPEESNQGAAREHEAKELDLLTDEQIVFARRPLSKTATFSKGRLASGKAPDKGAAGRYFLPGLSQGFERGSFSVLPVLFLDRSNSMTRSIVLFR